MAPLVQAVPIQQRFNPIQLRQEIDQGFLRANQPRVVDPAFRAEQRDPRQHDLSAARQDLLRGGAFHQPRKPMGRCSCRCWEYEVDVSQRSISLPSCSISFVASLSVIEVVDSSCLLIRSMTESGTVKSLVQFLLRIDSFDVADVAFDKDLRTRVSEVETNLVVAANRVWPMMTWDERSAVAGALCAFNAPEDEVWELIQAPGSPSDMDWSQRQGYARVLGRSEDLRACAPLREIFLLALESLGTTDQDVVRATANAALEQLAALEVDLSADELVRATSCGLLVGEDGASPIERGAATDRPRAPTGRQTSTPNE